MSQRQISSPFSPAAKQRLDTNSIFLQLAKTTTR
jgi:hypothetical protein